MLVDGSPISSSCVELVDNPARLGLADGDGEICAVLSLLSYVVGYGEVLTVVGDLHPG